MILLAEGTALRGGPDLRAQLDQSLARLGRRYRKRFKECRKNFSEEAVHELRIQTRRLLSKLDLFAALIPETRLDKARRLLKKRLDAFDPLRDTHVKLLAIEQLLPRYPEAKPFRDALVRREHLLARKIRRRLKNSGTRKLAKAIIRIQRHLKKFLEDRRHSGRTHARLVATIDAAFNCVVQLKRAIDPSDTATIHRTRVAFKKFRYMVDLLQPVLPGVTDGQIEAMQRYQTRMGHIQDVEVLLAGLKRFMKKSHSAKALRHLEVTLTRRRSTLVRNYLRSADELFDFWRLPASAERIQSFDSAGAVA